MKTTITITCNLEDNRTPENPLPEDAKDVLLEYAMEMILSQMYGGKYAGGDLDVQARVITEDPDDGVHYKGSWKAQLVHTQ